MKKLLGRTYNIAHFSLGNCPSVQSLISNKCNKYLRILINFIEIIINKWKIAEKSSSYTLENYLSLSL